MQIAFMHELICIICKLGVSRFKYDFLRILFQQRSLAVTGHILVMKHDRKLGFVAFNSENISTGRNRALFSSFVFPIFLYVLKFLIFIFFPKKNEKSGFAVRKEGKRG